MLLSDRLAQVYAGPEGPAGRGLLRLRRHPDPRVLGRGLLPRPDPQREGRAARGDPHHRDGAARRRDRGGLREARRDRAQRPRRPPPGRRHGGRRAGVRQEARGPRLPRGVAARAGPPPDGAHRRARLLGHPLPARGGRPDAGHRPRAEHRARGRRGRHPHRPGRRADPVAGGQGARRPRVRRPRTASTSRRRYAYSNGNEDIDFLSQVGFPAATTPEDRLREHATAEGWPVLDFRSARPAQRAPRSPARPPRWAASSPASAPGRRSGCSTAAGARPSPRSWRCPRSTPSPSPASASTPSASSTSGSSGRRCSCSTTRASSTSSSSATCCAATSPASPSRS